MTELRSQIARRAGWVAAMAVGVAFAAVAFASCFNPNIPSNSFRCNTTDPDPVCPAGQMCVSGWCVNPGDNPPGTDSTVIPGTDSAPGTDGGIVCGDGIAEAGEQCDITTGAFDCTSLGFAGGTLSCDTSCMFDSAACTNCGNNTLDAGETCDGTDVGAETCATQGFASGTLGCNASCESFDVSACVAPPGCPDGTIVPPEECEPGMLGGADCASATGGTLTMGVLDCTAACLFDTSGCSECGDDLAQGAELCDGTDNNGETCMTQGFVSGTLGCNASCLSFDTSMCSSCGNDTIEGSELCDGTDLGSETCMTQGFLGGGALACNVGCTGFVTTGCLECDMDIDCTVPGALACDTGTNTCVLCFGTSTAACGATETCNASDECACGGATSATGEACVGTQNPNCIAGTACGCDADSTCGAMETCNVAMGRCECGGGPGPMAGEACVAADAPNCVAGTCACDADSACHTDETCNSGGGACECGTTTVTAGPACPGAAATCSGTVCDCDGAGGNPACAAGETCDGTGNCM